MFIPYRIDPSEFDISNDIYNEREYRRYYTRRKNGLLQRILKDSVHCRYPIPSVEFFEYDSNDYKPPQVYENIDLNQTPEKKSYKSYQNTPIAKNIDKWVNTQTEQNSFASQCKKSIRSMIVLN